MKTGMPFINPKDLDEIGLDQELSPKPAYTLIRVIIRNEDRILAEVEQVLSKPSGSSWHATVGDTARADQHFIDLAFECLEQVQGIARRNARILGVTNKTVRRSLEPTEDGRRGVACEIRTIEVRILWLAIAQTRILWKNLPDPRQFQA